VQDLVQTNSSFDRAYHYDHVGRITEALTGSEARGGVNGDGPYRDTYGYDVWGQSTSLTRRAWDTYVESNLSVNGPSGRTSAWTYDADGRVTADDEGRTYKYDAAGRLVLMTYHVTVGHVTQTRTRKRGYDGDGRAVRVNYWAGTGYRLMSSVLGGAEVTMLDAAGQKSSTNVYAAGGLIAVQSNDSVHWRHRTPFDTTERETDASGAEVSRAELNPAGADFGIQPPPDSGTDTAWDNLVTPRFGDPLAPSDIMVNGVAMPSLMAGMFVSDMFARGSTPGARGLPNGKGITVMDQTFIHSYLDEVDPNGSYKFEYTDPQTGKTGTYTGHGSVVSTDISYYTLNPVTPDTAYITWRRLSSEEIEPRKNLIANMLTPRCVEFVNNLVNTTTGKPYDAKNQLLTDLMKIVNSGGIYYRSDLHFYGAGGSQSGSLAKGNAGIEIDGTYSPLRSTLPYNISNDAGLIFNELMHAVAAVADYDGSRALANIGITPVDSSGNPIPFPQAPSNLIKPYSMYFHAGIRNVCNTNQ
jgi:hypothetical protein